MLGVWQSAKTHLVALAASNVPSTASTRRRRGEALVDPVAWDLLPSLPLACPSFGPCLWSDAFGVVASVPGLEVQARCPVPLLALPHLPPILLAPRRSHPRPHTIHPRPVAASQLSFTLSLLHRPDYPQPPSPLSPLSLLSDTHPTCLARSVSQSTSPRLPFTVVAEEHALTFLSLPNQVRCPTRSRAAAHPRAQERM